MQRAMAKDRTERYANAKDLAADLNALVDDPTRSTERAKITGPRKKPPLGQRKSGAKLLGWAAGVAVLIAAIVVTVTFAMGGPSKPEAVVRQPAVPPPPPADAAAPPIDAPAPLMYTIHTNPKGGMILRQSEEEGLEPQTIPIMDEDKNVEISAKLGDLEGTIVINPREGGKLDRTIQLRKLGKGDTPLPPPQHPRTLPHAGSAAAAPGIRGDGTMPPTPFGH